MRYIDHHAHMASRTTDDYAHMALTGCVALTEPAFWAGWDRSTPEGFDDYFRQLMEFEPKRAAQYGIQHYTWLGMNPKESDDREMSKAVLARLPAKLDGPTVLGIGEIGLNRVTANEITTYTEQVEMAERRPQQGLRDPGRELRGTGPEQDALRRRVRSELAVHRRAWIVRSGPSAVKRARREAKLSSALRLAPARLRGRASDRASGR